MVTDSNPTWLTTSLSNPLHLPKHFFSSLTAYGNIGLEKKKGIWGESGCVLTLQRER